jgi:sec-independent protein translocase protein TatA
MLVVLLVYGPKRLPEMGKSLGRGLREFKDSVTDHTSLDEGEATSATRQLPKRPRDHDAI